MKIRQVIEMKDKCEKRLQGLQMALNISGDKFLGVPYDDKITITPTQAEDIRELLMGYHNLLTDILDKAEVEI